MIRAAKLVAKQIHVGTPEAGFDVQLELEDSVAFHFHNFESLTTIKGEAVMSPKFSCAGYEWILEIYPGGDSNSEDGMVAVNLRNKSPSEVLTRFEIILMQKSGKIRKTRCSEGERLFTSNYRWGWCNFYSRDDILDESESVLNEGSLTFVVVIKPSEGFRGLPVKPRHESTLAANIFKLYGNEETVDVAFKVDNAMFYAHKMILEVQAPELFELVEQFNLDTPMLINDVKPIVFGMMLKYVYGKRICEDDWNEHFKQILDASGKYGFSELKLEAEAQYMVNMSLTVDNVVNELLYVDGTHCLDAKREIIKYIVKNGKSVLASSSFPKLAESSELMTEVMMEFANSNESKN